MKNKIIQNYMFKNIYFYRARLLPALLTSIPMLVFINKVFAVKYADALKSIYEVLPIIVHMGMSAAIIFLLLQINRLVAKEIFQKLYFKEELFMPTTNHLLLNNTYYPIEIRNTIRTKILSKFQIRLLDIAEEGHDEQNARKIISTAVSQIRIVLKDNAMLLQHNIEYGFFRNLIGGCVLAILFSVTTFIYGSHFHFKDQQIIGLMCFALYLIPILCSKFIMNYYGNYYSKILYEQFLSLD